MKKIIIIAVAIIGFTTGVRAQSATGSAQQTIQLALSNALDITFTGNGSATGATVNMPFSNINDYANGVESSTQQIKVRSNKTFNITVKSSAAYFSVTNGSNTTTSTMAVANVLDVKVASNQAGGTIAGGYANYNTVSNTAASLITGASNGGNQTFSVQYKSTPGFAYPAGSYSVDVVYTATQQ